jgi:mono/diheme cytochrome c family protein/glucose/arabinose dehydrogenase/type 1 glutamine amidotransferase
MKRNLALLLASLFAWTAGAAQDRLHFKGKEGPGKGKKIVLIAGDEEYRTEESCPMLGKILSQRHGFDCVVLFSLDPTGKYIDPNNQTSMSGVEEIADADLVIIGTRFRRLNDDQYAKFAAYLNAGKPIMGFRTSTHAFSGSGKTGDFKWSEFGLKILGERWVSHHGKHKVQGARGVIEKKHAGHAVLNSVEDVFGTSDVYGVVNLDENKAAVLLRGAVTETLDPASKPIAGEKNDPMMAAAWLREYTSPNGKAKGQAFCTTLGASEDFRSTDLRRLIVNVSYHLTGLNVPERADVRYVDPFPTTFYTYIRAKDYYKNRNLQVSDFELGKTAATGLPKAPAQPQKSKGKAKAADKKKPAPKPQAKAKAKAKKKRLGPAEKDDTTYAQPAKAKSKAASVQLPSPPAKGERIVLLGSMLGERMLHFGHFETELHKRFPTEDLIIRNMCNPGDTPGFRAHSSRTDPWAFPGAEKFHPELATHYGIGHYPSQDEWLTELKADTIVAFFGYNESFDGLEKLANFKAELSAWIDHTHSLSYNGKTAPKIVLVTPIAFEDRSADYDLPKGSEENKRLAAYAKAVQEVAKVKNVGIVDVFSISKKWFAAKGSKLTINGCHLDDAGYAKLAPVLADSIFGRSGVSTIAPTSQLRTAVNDKNYFWFNDYRMLNGVHVYGRRWKPYGNENYPEEIEKMRQMTRLRDERIWDIALGKKNLPPVADNKTRKLTPIKTNFNRPIEYLGREKALEKFTLREGYKIELFASETEFPDLKSPVQMSFDNKGRLWVAVIPSYPHFKPGGERPNDKLLIFEDTDGDGRADRQKVFAEGLNLPIGFELAPEGVYLSQEPNLCLLIDDDKDDRADRMEILVSGFDTHDTHHAISAYCADASGAFYMCEGRFLHSQVETPYGPQRMTDGGVWRFNPKNWRLERYSQSDYSNPWGITFDEWNQCFISDASSGKNFYGVPVSAKIPHGLEVPQVAEFAPKRSRPTSGTEFVSSRHFPKEDQGNFMINNSISFLGTSMHKIWEEGSGFSGRVAGDLVSSSDPNFRPVDCETAPDGSLYIVDWHNALIGHMQHNARDPNRDSDHGRIYRVTYPSRPLVKPAKIAGASIEQLLNNLKLPEYRTRYRTRRELRGRPAAQVLPAVKKWAKAQNPKQRDYAHRMCEALWVTWGHNAVDEDLLQICLNSEDHRARSAATGVLRYNYKKISGSTKMLLQAAADPHPRPRLEAIVTASWMDNADGARIALEAVKAPFDRWMGPVFDIVMKNTLSDDVDALKGAGKLNLANNQRAADFLAGKLNFKKAPDEEYGPTKKLSAADLKTYKLGKSVFHRDGHCATCHQPNGKGMANAYPPLTKNPWIEDDTRMIKIALKGLWGSMEVNGKHFDPSKGVPPMPGFGPVCTDEEIAAVINYARNSFGNTAKFVTPAEVAKIRKQTEGRRDFYMVEDIMKEHPIKGWEKWKKAEGEVGGFE